MVGGGAARGLGRVALALALAALAALAALGSGAALRAHPFGAGKAQHRVGHRHQKGEGPKGEGRHHQQRSHRGDQSLLGWQGEKGRARPRGGGTGGGGGSDLRQGLAGQPWAWPGKERGGAQGSREQGPRQGDSEGRWAGGGWGKNPQWNGWGDPLLRGVPPGVRVRQVSEFPPAYVAEGLLTPEECEHLIGKAKPKLERNTIVDTRGGIGENAKAVELNKLSKSRTSSGAFLERRADAVIAAIEAKLMAFAGFPEVHGEPMQVLLYEHGQQYTPHTDTFPKNYMKMSDGMQRSATALAYLSDVESGGETAFPQSRLFSDAMAHSGGELSECGRQGVAVKPRKGSVLLFYSLDMRGKPSEYAQHTGCPVLAGTKWTVTKWIHELPFRGRRFPGSNPEPE